MAVLAALALVVVFTIGVPSRKEVVIVGPIPEPTYNVPHRLFVGRYGLARAPTPADYEGRHSVALAFFKSLKGREGASFVWPAEQLCKSGMCPTMARGVPLYFDNNHLRASSNQGPDDCWTPVSVI
jgi:SGNH domain (fused to AT3 domains)